MAYSTNLPFMPSERLHSVELIKNSSLLRFFCINEFSWQKGIHTTPWKELVIHASFSSDSQLRSAAQRRREFDGRRSSGAE